MVDKQNYIKTSQQWQPIFLRLSKKSCLLQKGERRPIASQAWRGTTHLLSFLPSSNHLLRLSCSSDEIVFSSATPRRSLAAHDSVLDQRQAHLFRICKIFYFTGSGFALRLASCSSRMTVVTRPVLRICAFHSATP